MSGATRRRGPSKPAEDVDTSESGGHSQRQDFPRFIFGLMAGVPFVGILSELVPSGILPQMIDGLGRS